LAERIVYVWVDTCCMDKSSSAELSQAINSMYERYRWSDICYVYLSDWPEEPTKWDDVGKNPPPRWFTRRWTI